MKKFTKSYILIFAAMLTGMTTGLIQNEALFKAAEAVSGLFMNFLKLMSVPIVFLSIVSALTGMRGFQEMKTLGRKVFGYTLFTTLIAATTALTLYLLIDPSRSSLTPAVVSPASQSGSYMTFLLNVVPSNFVKAFLENNVIGVAFIAFLLGIATLKLPEENIKPIHQLFSSLFKAVLKMTEFIILFIPIGIWAFTTLLVKELQNNFSQFQPLVLYLSCVVGANLLQALIVLPLLLKAKGLSPWKIARGSSKALMLAFFSKSSNATLPVTLQCAEKNLAISSRVAHFTLPLCTVINMNACAAFILTTVLFVSMGHGMTFTPIDLGMWVLLATLAAIGNAGVPMGCFFLSTTFLIAMNVPLTAMGLILPFYAFLDMLETAVNVWSDLCVTALVDKELRSSLPISPDRLSSHQ